MKMRTDVLTANTNIDGEKVAFSIAASGVAFRTLVDSIYSNKIESPMREVMSNAYDSHRDAGVIDRPFHVTLPTSLDPVFAVRDFGTGMTDEMVKRLYTTLFDSTRRDDNNTQGGFGLGAKSPLAYSDTFTIRAFDGTKVRTYVVSLTSTGVPELTVVGEVPSTDERGILVMFPVRPADVGTFQGYARKLAYGFAVQPIFDGPPINLATPVLVGDFWRVYRRSEVGPELRSHSGTWLQQGCAIYPAVTHHGHAQVGSEYVAVVDVPIGTLMVTASRESLAYDETTTKEQRDWTSLAAQEIETAVRAEIAKASTKLEQARAALEWAPISTRVAVNNQALNLSLVPQWPEANGNATDAFRAHRDKDFPGWCVYLIKRQRGNPLHTVVSFRYGTDVTSAKFIVDDGTKVLRRNLRINSFVARNNRGYVHLIKDDGSGRATRRVKRLLGLDDSQIINVADLPDVTVNRAPRIPGVAGTKPKIADLWKPGQVWVRRDGRKLHPADYAGYRLDSGVSLDAHRTYGPMVRFLGFKTIDVVELTDFQISKILPDPAMEFSTYIKAQVAKTLTVPVVRRIAAYVAVTQGNFVYQASPHLLDHVGITPADVDTLTSLVAVINTTMIRGKLLTESLIRVYDNEVASVRARLTDQFPLLCTNSGDEAIKSYIKLASAKGKP